MQNNEVEKGKTTYEFKDKDCPPNYKLSLKLNFKFLIKKERKNTNAT